MWTVPVAEDGFVAPLTHREFGTLETLTSEASL